MRLLRMAKIFLECRNNLILGTRAESIAQFNLLSRNRNFHFCLSIYAIVRILFTVGKDYHVWRASEALRALI